MPSLSSFFPTVKPGKSRSIRNAVIPLRSEEHTSELQSRSDLVCRLLLEKKKNRHNMYMIVITYHAMTELDGVCVVSVMREGRVRDHQRTLRQAAASTALMPASQYTHMSD